MIAEGNNQVLQISGLGATPNPGEARHPHVSGHHGGASLADTFRPLNRPHHEKPAGTGDFLGPLPRPARHQFGSNARQYKIEAVLGEGATGSLIKQSPRDYPT